MRKEGWVCVSTAVEPEMRRALRRAATWRDVSMAAIVREAIRKEVALIEVEESRQSVLDWEPPL